MAKIVVFDSGFGSLSVIRPIQKAIKSDMIYYADQKISHMEKNQSLN